MRGIAALRFPHRPIWFIQRADQRVDDWELPGDRPIFTQHVENQFVWMWEGSLSSEWPLSYAELCGLSMCPQLLEMCRQTKAK